MTERFGRSAALRAALQMTGSTYVAYATGLIVSVLIARGIGPADFGRYSYLVWLAGVLIMAGNNGLTTSGIRFVSECIGRGSIADARNVHGWLQWRQYACMVVVAAAYLAAMPFFTPAGWQHNELWLLATIILVSVFAKGQFMFGISIAKGYGRFDVEALSTVVVSLLNAVAVGVLMVLHAALLAYLLLFAVTCVAYGVLGAIMLRRANIVEAHGSLAAPLRSRLKHHLLWTVVLTIGNQFSNKSVETYLLNAVVGPAAVGFFAIASALTRGGIELLCSGLTSVLMPSMAHAFGAQGQERVNTILSHSVRYFQFLGLLIAGAGVFWAPVAVELMYGTRYEPVVNVLRIMIAVGGLTLAEGAFGALLSTTDNQRLRAGFSIVSIAATVIAAIALIPKYGLIGAVLAHAISRLAVVVFTTSSIVRIMHLRLPWRELGRLLLAAVLAALLGAATLMVAPGKWVGFAAGLVYALTYVGATVALRAWRATDSGYA
ncbi:MAG: lipopolysaccharide biosynthesis protein, partial [Rhodanobacteraceae bacterium]